MPAPLKNYFKAHIDHRKIVEVTQIIKKMKEVPNFSAIAFRDREQKQSTWSWLPVSSL